MEQLTIKNFYDELFEFINYNCTRIDYPEHLAGTDVLIIAVGVKPQIMSLITYLNNGKEKPEHIYMIVQKNMMPVLRDLENEQCRFIEWQGPYTLEVISRVQEQIDLKTVKHLFYQGRQPLDFRDINLYDILLEIRHKYGENDEIKLYMQDIKEQVYLYKQPEKLRKGMDVYRSIDEYLEE